MTRQRCASCLGLADYDERDQTPQAIRHSVLCKDCAAGLRYARKRYREWLAVARGGRPKPAWSGSAAQWREKIKGRR